MGFTGIGLIFEVSMDFILTLLFLRERNLKDKTIAGLSGTFLRYPLSATTHAFGENRSLDI